MSKLPSAYSTTLDREIDVAEVWALGTDEAYLAFRSLGLLCPYCRLNVFLRGPHQKTLLINDEQKLVEVAPSFVHRALDPDLLKDYPEEVQNCYARRHVDRSLTMIEGVTRQQFLRFLSEQLENHLEKSWYWRDRDQDSFEQEILLESNCRARAIRLYDMAAQTRLGDLLVEQILPELLSGAHSERLEPFQQLRAQELTAVVRDNTQWHVACVTNALLLAFSPTLIELGITIFAGILLRYQEETNQSWNTIPESLVESQVVWLFASVPWRNIWAQQGHTPEVTYE